MILALAAGLAVCVAAFFVLQAVLFDEAPGLFRRADVVQVRWGEASAPLSTGE